MAVLDFSKSFNFYKLANQLNILQAKPEIKINIKLTCLFRVNKNKAILLHNNSKNK